jgi:hypothetical protein
MSSAYSDADKHAPPWSRDDEPKEECDNLLLVEHEVQRAASSEVGSFSYHHHFYSKLSDVTLSTAFTRYGGNSK